MRRKDREVVDPEKIRQILERGKVFRLALFDGDYPYVVPLHYGFVFDEDGLVFYAHSAREGRKLDLIRANPKVCVEVESDVALTSGGEVACRYGAAFASVIARGRASIVGDPEEKARALRLLMKNQTGRDFAIGAKEAEIVAVIRIDVDSYTAKSRPFPEEHE